METAKARDKRHDDDTLGGQYGTRSPQNVVDEITLTRGILMPTFIRELAAALLWITRASAIPTLVRSHCDDVHCW
jgi:hypothetical protein